MGFDRRSRSRGVAADSDLFVGTKPRNNDPHWRAAQELRAAIPDVLDAYLISLQRVESVLAEEPEPWQSCRRQAASILEDCISTLECGCPPETTEAEEYTRLLGANRALQRVPVAESVRAVEVLWSATQSAAQAASASAPPQYRAVILQKMNAAFRAAASVRLYAGSQGHEETRDRILVPAGASSHRVPPRTAATSTAVPGGEERGDSPEELTARERQVLDAVGRALSNRQIANRLGISEGTVKRHLYNIFNKLGATSRMEAVLKGTERR